MHKVMLDTGFVIALLDSKRSSHATAKAYYKYCLEKEYPLYISSIAIYEYCIAGKLEEIPLDSITDIAYNTQDGAASENVKFKEHILAGEPRNQIKDDFKIIGHAMTRGHTVLITDDEKMHTHINNLRQKGIVALRSILISEPFCISCFNNGQSELSVS